MADRPEIPPKGSDAEREWRTAGDRIQTLLDSCAASGAAAYERAQELVREVVGLYGAGLERIMQLAGEPGLTERLATDDLVASLLLVHGLHPHDAHRRVSEALDRVRPYLGSHGGDVDLLEIDGGVVRVALKGSCKSCPSSAVTLELAVEDAVRAAAPEIASIEVVAAEPDSAHLISVGSLMSRVHTKESAGSSWHPVPDVADLGPGEVGGFLVAGVSILACRVGDELFAYHDRCGNCGETMAGAVLHRPMGSAIGEAVLRCPRCHAHFDAVHAGAGLDGNDSATSHLDPIPLLLRDGVPSVAVLAEATGVM